MQFRNAINTAVRRLSVAGAAVLSLALAIGASGAILKFGGSRLMQTGEDARIVRVFNDSIKTIVIENLDGAIEAQTWPSTAVSVTASRSSNGNDARLESEVSIEQLAGDTLKVVAKPDSRANPIRIAVCFPPSAQLYVRGGKERVAIKGLAAGISVETGSGSLAIYLPEKSTADLSVRTIQGSIESHLPVEVFGKADSHLLDGKLGQGGAPVIARSQRGQISLLPDDDSRLPAMGKYAAELRATGGESNLVARNAPAPPAPGFQPATLAKQEGFAGSDEAGISHSDQHVVKLSTRLVNLNVKVTDSMGKPLPLLNKADFQVLEESVPQEISHFEPVTAPLNIVLLLDLSGSTEDKMKIMKKAAKRFVDSMNPEDNIAVAAFTRRFFVISNFTRDKKLLKDRIGDIKNRHSGTAYYDAMWATLNLLDEVNVTRKAIVVLTDGVDNSLDHPDDRDFEPKHGFEELMSRIEEADVTIYPIYLDTEFETVIRRGDSNHDAYSIARKQVAQLAEQTGAVMFKADRAEDIEGAYQQVAAELHSLYSIAYTPNSIKKDGKWRKIGITVSREGAKARTRRGYYAK
ncbi:MAG TPA: VWA domain-containing protein [Blastocatellia bacterium]|nr:VWA domain-containing protein [Blastocatellia bacterium]